jgi:hypothetical protein
MARNRAKGGALGVAIILLLVFVIGAIAAITNGFKSGVRTFAVIRNDTQYVFNESRDNVFSSMEKLSIENFSTETRKYNVRVYLYGGDEETDFDMQYYAESGYSWKTFCEEKKRDVTASFTLSFFGTDVYIKSNGMTAVLDAYDPGIILTNELPAGDRFVLEVSMGKEVISIYFSLSDDVGHVELDQSSIVF